MSLGRADAPGSPSAFPGTDGADLSPEAPAGVFDWPRFGLEDDVRPLLAEARRRAVPAALATVSGVEGGAPRGLGAQMAFAAGDLKGFLSGGCIEADVALHAREVLAEGRPRSLVYGEGGPPDLQLPCGSRLEILLEALEPDDPAIGRLLELGAARRTALYLSDGVRRRCVAGAAAPDEGAYTVARLYAPRTRLVVLGAEPIAIALADLAVRMNLEVVFIRPKGPLEEPSPGLRYLRGAAAEELRRLDLDPRTAVAVLTHEGETEEEALRAALPSPAGYVGVLGSRRRIPARLERLRAAGLTEGDLERLRAPIGLRIGGKSPFEIALAILAEITEVMASRVRP